MKKMFVFYLIYTLSFHTFADCGEINLDTVNGPLKNIPIYSQGEKDICYADIAAEIVDAYRFSHGDTNTNHLTSPLITGIFYSGQHRAEINNMPGIPISHDIELGVITDAVDTLRQKGSCDEKDLYRNPNSSNSTKRRCCT